MNKGDVDYSLYFILNVTHEAPNTDDLIALALAASEGGASMLQLRAKTLTGRRFYDLAKRLKTVLDIPLVINDRLDVALAVEAAGIHLGKHDVPFESVRKLAPRLILGVSCYGDLRHAEQAEQAGADYLAFGACYPTTTKSDAPVIAHEVLTEARRFGLPRIAIGGITAERAPEVLLAGASGIAVSGAIEQATDPARAAAHLRHVIDARHATGP